MGALHWLVTHIAPIFIVSSPITSYADQIYSIYRTRSSAGFSLDIPLIMLVASITKVFYWLGARYDTSLLLQAALMIVIQTFLLHVALTYRPAQSSTLPFSIVDSKSSQNATFYRPYSFWQWRNTSPYWTFLLYFTVTLLLLQYLIGDNPLYTSTLGYSALAVEATLPLPQILANQRRKSCVGFRISVLVNWLIGDAFKMTFFFLKGDRDVPWAFKACGIFQAACDCYLGLQYYLFGNGDEGTEKAGWERKEEIDKFRPGIEQEGL